LHTYLNYAQHPEAVARRRDLKQSIIALVAYRWGLIDGKAALRLLPWWLRLASARKDKLVHTTSLAGRTILIVEDEYLIAMNISRAFESAGALVMTAATLGHAKSLIEHPELSGAVLDFGLKDGNANPLRARLQERDIPYVLHSGYRHFGDARERGAVVPKPANPTLLIDALVNLLQRPQ
jgi:CheY-like chemotaxis protein